MFTQFSLYELPLNYKQKIRFYIMLSVTYTCILFCFTDHFWSNRRKENLTILLHYAEKKQHWASGSGDITELEKDIELNIDPELKFSNHTIIQVTKENKILDMTSISYTGWRDAQETASGIQQNGMVTQG